MGGELGYLLAVRQVYVLAAMSPLQAVLRSRQPASANAHGPPPTPAPHTLQDPHRSWQPIVVRQRCRAASPSPVGRSILRTAVEFGVRSCNLHLKQAESASTPASSCLRIVAKGKQTP